jgi:hypothetical protein
MVCPARLKRERLHSVFAKLVVRMMGMLRNWLQRHQHPASQVLHAIGVPMTFVGSAVLVVLGHPWWALAAFVAGYVLQFIGHAIEGNDPGELILFKKLLGKPYVAVAPRDKDNSETTN